MQKEGVSVIICCYNSAGRLSETLKHLAMQVVPKDLVWEIIVIDNASTDNTQALAITEWKKYNVTNVGFKVIGEPNPGKNHALRRGFLESSYDYLITCDDDNWLSPGYIQQAAHVMSSRPEVAIVGGQGIYEPERPVSPLITGFEKFYINGPQDWANTQHWVYGAGSVCRKQVFLNLIAQQWGLVTPGRIGKKLNGGEDVEFCLAGYLAGWQINYDEQLIFRHFVPLSRQNPSYLINIHFWQSYSNVLLNSYYSVINKDQRPFDKMLYGWFWSSCKTLIKQSILLLFQILRFKPLSISQKFSYAGTRGTFSSLLKNRKRLIMHHEQLKILEEKIKTSLKEPRLTSPIAANKDER